MLQIASSFLVNAEENVRLTRTESLFITAILFLLDSAALGYFTVQKTIDFYATKLLSAWA